MSKTRSLSLIAACALDRFLGDPEGYPHPVRIMGRCIDRMEARLSPREPGGTAALYAGCMIAAAVCAGAWMSAHILLLLPGAALVETLLLYTAVAAKDLEKSSLRVAEDLEAGDVAAARGHLAALAGRDPEDLDENGICRAVVESVAENYVDGVLAPLLWGAVGGAPAAMAFKAASTLDSMLGHRDARHLRLGWCSARLDDLAVFPAARLSLLLSVAAARLCGNDHSAALRVGMRDRLAHPSPNSAHAEAAFAGALELKLGGPACYAGARRELPEIGDGTREVGTEHVRQAVRLMKTATLLGLCLAALLALPLPGGGKGRRVS